MIFGVPLIPNHSVVLWFCDAIAKVVLKILQPFLVIYTPHNWAWGSFIDIDSIVFHQYLLSYSELQSCLKQNFSPIHEWTNQRHMWEAKAIHPMAQGDLLMEWQTGAVYPGAITSMSNEISSRCFVKDHAIRSIFIPLVEICVSCNQLTFEVSYTMLTWCHWVDSTRVFEM